MLGSYVRDILIAFTSAHFCLTLATAMYAFVRAGMGDWSMDFFDGTPIGQLSIAYVPTDDPNETFFHQISAMFLYGWDFILAALSLLHLGNYEWMNGHTGFLGLFFTTIKGIALFSIGIVILNLIQVLASMPFWYSRVGIVILGVALGGSTISFLLKDIGAFFGFG